MKKRIYLEGKSKPIPTPLTNRKVFALLTNHTLNTKWVSKPTNLRFFLGLDFKKKRRWSNPTGASVVQWKSQDSQIRLSNHPLHQHVWYGWLLSLQVGGVDHLYPMKLRGPPRFCCSHSELHEECPLPITDVCHQYDWLIKCNVDFITQQSPQWAIDVCLGIQQVL